VFVLIFTRVKGRILILVYLLLLFDISVFILSFEFGWMTRVQFLAGAVIFLFATGPSSILGPA